MLIPHEIRIVTDPVKWMSMNTMYIDECLYKYGMVRFPCNSVDTPEKLSNILKNYHGHDFFDGGMSAAPRKKLTDGVFTANEAPSSSVIPFHHEMAQCNEFPQVVAFACTQLPNKGGATNVADSGLVAKYMRSQHGKVSEILQKKQVRYTRKLKKEDDESSASGKSWVTTFGTNDKLTVDSILSQDRFEWEWTSDDSLILTSPPKSVFRTIQTPYGESEVFFNSILAATFGWDDVVVKGKVSRACVFGDGEEFDIHILNALEMCKMYMESIKVPILWKMGEFILLNNTRILHSREAFVGPRQVITSLLS
jgi:alpha-ketoglutarate-dependent taurine dioxygenase